MTVTTEPHTATFSARLKAATAQRHSTAETSTFVTSLMQGRLDTGAYVRLLSQYPAIYGALEEVADGFRKNLEPMTQPFLVPGLERTAAIEHDLQVLESLGFTRVQPVAVVQEYAAAIRACAVSPERFLAHHYLRYLGDLSGGQAIAALIQRHYGVPEDAVSMYRFPDLAKPKVFKDSYRTLLDAAPLSPAQQDALVDEAIAGFDFNARMFVELAG